jgi:membrane-associated phospholipid phosphatase
VSPAVAELIAYATSTSGANSNAGKYFFANATTNGKTPVSADALTTLKEIGGTVDVFGKGYGLPSGTPGADTFGNSRPFQTEPSPSSIIGPDYFNVPVGDGAYNRGPIMNLINSPSYPSGHTTYGYIGALLLAILVPSDTSRWSPAEQNTGTTVF